MTNRKRRALGIGLIIFPVIGILISFFIYVLSDATMGGTLDRALLGFVKIGESQEVSATTAVAVETVPEGQDDFTKSVRVEFVRIFVGFLALLSFVDLIFGVPIGIYLLMTSPKEEKNRTFKT